MAANSPEQEAQIRAVRSRTGLTHDARPCGKLSVDRKPCERPTQPYEPWCSSHCSDDEKQLGAALRRAYWEGHRTGYGEGVRKGYEKGYEKGLNFDPEAEARVRALMKNFRI